MPYIQKFPKSPFFELLLHAYRFYGLSIESIEVYGDSMSSPPEKKVCQQVTNLPNKYNSWPARWGYANVNIVKAIFG